MWNGAGSGVGQQCRTSTLVVRMVMGVRMVAVGGDNFFIRRRRFPELAQQDDVQTVVRDTPALAWELFRLAWGLPV